jgi:hypothetical protein
MIRDNNTEVCDYRKELEVKRQTFSALRDITKCGCLNQCNSVNYKFEVIAHKLLNESEATIEFKFKDVDIVPLRRYRPFSLSEFLAQSGGMLGVFAGISMFSIFEGFF